MTTTEHPPTEAAALDALRDAAHRFVDADDALLDPEAPSDTAADPLHDERHLAVDALRDALAAYDAYDAAR